MKPSLASEELRKSLTQYLTTTFALAEPTVRDALERFLEHQHQGIFRGPYLRIRTKFRKVNEKTWQNPLQWTPTGFVPHLHQAEAWRRLSSLGKRAEPSLISTGTGSGKTESFLIPVLDHCQRERANGHHGVKAVFLYPMNALATDQAQRINELLTQTGMEQVTAALYIGDTPEIGYPKVMTIRSEIRRNPPDILITNYKMLDLLLQRAEDLTLWEDARIAYVVVDEFHTYDGAQATDVAMLLRRLAAATGHSRPGEPLGDICPVATSATLGEGGDRTEIRRVAEKVFGVPFPEQSVIGENRLTVEEFMDELDIGLPLPSPDELLSWPDPLQHPTAMDDIAGAVTGKTTLGPAELGRYLRRHILTHAVLEILNGQPSQGHPRTMGEILELLPKRGAYTWGATIRDNPRRAAAALARFIALLSMARDPDNPQQPLVLIETHIWARAVSRLTRVVDTVPAFAWEGEPPVREADSLLDASGQRTLPAVYCRHCGRSGWAVFSPERDPAELVVNPDKIYRSNVGSEKKRVRALIKATDEEVAAGVRVLVLEGDRVRPLDPQDTLREDNVYVLGDVGTSPESSRNAEKDRCPACNMDEGIRFLGAGLASLASVAITQLFARDQLEPAQRKTLLFNDSVQDAAHRAGFVANRSYAFSLRRLITSRVASVPSILLHDLIADLAAEATEADALPAVVPPDLHDMPEIDAILAETTSGSPKAWNLIGERLAFQTILEVRVAVAPGSYARIDRHHGCGGAARGSAVDGGPRSRRALESPVRADRSAVPGTVSRVRARPAGADALSRRDQARVAGRLDQERGHQTVRHHLGSPRTACPPSRAGCPRPPSSGTVPRRVRNSTASSRIRGGCRTGRCAAWGWRVGRPVSTSRSCCPCSPHRASSPNVSPRTAPHRSTACSPVTFGFGSWITMRSPTRASAVTAARGSRPYIRRTSTTGSASLVPDTVAAGCCPCVDCWTGTTTTVICISVLRSGW